VEWDAEDARSDDTIDRRGAGRSGGFGGRGGAPGGGRGLPFPIPGGKVAGGGLMGVLVAVLVAVVLPALSGGGFDVSTAGLDRMGVPGVEDLPASGADADASIPPGVDPDGELADFSKVLITDTNDFWTEQFAAAGRDYERAKLVLFTGGVTSGCGAASAAMGPFYCPADRRVYVDLGFFEELSSRFGAAGDFAQAYVIAHEVGHHVQQELGISAEVQRLERDAPTDATGPAGLSTRLELQADCLAGVWAYSKQGEGVLEAGDVDEALRAAAGVGDDAIQRRATGRVDPEGFTHGSSAQRSRWFRAGLADGRAEACDTFSVDEP